MSTIYSTPNTPFLSVAAGTITGLVGTINVRIEDTSNNIVVPAMTLGIVESGTAVYNTDIDSPDCIRAPLAIDTYLVFWNDGTEDSVPDTLVVSGVDPNAAIVASTPVYSNAGNTIGFGPELEVVQRSALVQIKQNVNAQIGFVEGIWASRDVAFSQQMDRYVPPTEIERPSADDFHEGLNPSILDSPIDRFPSVSVWCHRAEPDSEQFDQFDTYSMRLSIAVICKSSAEACGEADASSLVERRTQRMSEAVVRCISLDRTLGGVVLPIRRPPSVNQSIIDRRQFDESFWFVQGVQVDYVVSKHST